MTLTHVLNSDIETLWPLLRRGVRWWITELGNLTPPGLRARLRVRRPTAAFDADGTLMIRSPTGRSMESGKARGRAVDLALPDDSVLICDLLLPALDREDLRQLVELDLERLTPLKAEHALFSLELLPRPAGSPRQPVRLAVARRAEVVDAVARAKAQGLTPSRVGPAAPDGSIGFDFMLALRLQSRGEGLSPEVVWWSVAAFLFAANLSLLSLRDTQRLDAVAQVVEAQQPGVDAAQRLRRSLQAEASLRSLVLTRQAENEPTRLLAALGAVLPRGAWVQRLEWNGRTLRLVGFKPRSLDLLSALTTTGRFVNPRNLSTADGAQRATTEPFDVIADATSRTAKR